MAIKATSFRRQLIMAVLLTGAVAGGVIRHFSDKGTTLHDVGTLLLVLWLPAVGNLIAFIVRWGAARRASTMAMPMASFDPAAPFVATVHARMDLLPLPAGALAKLDPADARAALIQGSQGFTVRLAEPVAQWLARHDGTAPLALQCLRPEVAAAALPPGTPVHLLVLTSVVAKGQVVAPE